MTTSGRTAICPGTFDPLTNGHLDVIERAAALFDRIIVAVMRDTGKATLFPVDERVALVAASCRHLGNVEADSFQELLVAYARERGAVAVVKGVRTGADFERERQMAMMNRALHPGLHTVLMMTSPDTLYISSSLVREIWGLGGDVSGMVPAPVAEALRRKRP